MAQQREKGGRVVFIGNIPYGVSEEQICEIFGRIGTVVGFRLVYDKETQRPKGFGFLEYTNADDAASAVRNLNDFEIMNRTLRVDYSNDNGGGKGKTGGDGGGGLADRAPPPAHFNQPSAGIPNGADPAAIPPLPPGQPLTDGLTAPDAISRTLKAIPAPQLLDFISQMKTLVTQNPAQATAVLAQAPQLGYAVFQALLLLNLVDTSILGSLIAGAPPSAAVPPPQPQQQLPYQQPHPQTSSYAQPPQHQYAPPQHQGYPPHGYAPTPPVPQSSYQPPPQQQQAPQHPNFASLPPEQQAMLQQVMRMTREDIYALEEGPRQQIMQLRAQFGQPV
ncbi:hypothetical protein LTR62_001115 [Meristemomyces frigidus]|uniref:RRM domain-containing protein n=1 Tax=Meristemomyces frigidus TaxID=1508187 RepID=A0AAN7TN90_9PEZI|nr:hypothetical protein LTR62_001115 [Meristemomyces frigidus]